MEPHYLTLHIFAEHSTQLKLTCPHCSHVTSKKVPGYYPRKMRLVRRCWFCKEVTWIIQVINKPGSPD